MNNEELKFKSRKTAIYHRINNLLAERGMTEGDLYKKIESDSFRLKNLLNDDSDLSLREIAMIEAALDEKLFKFNRNLGIEEED